MYCYPPPGVDSREFNLYSPKPLDEETAVEDMDFSLMNRADTSNLADTIKDRNKPETGRKYVRREKEKIKQQRGPKKRVRKVRGERPTGNHSLIPGQSLPTNVRL